MAIYYIGKSEKPIMENEILGGSETIYGTNEGNNFSRLSLLAEEKELSEANENKYLKDIRFAMEERRLFDGEAKFVFDDKDFYDKVFSFTEPEMTITEKDARVVSDIKELLDSLKNSK